MFNDLPAIFSVTFFGVEYRVIALSLLILAATILFEGFVTGLFFAFIKNIVNRAKVDWEDDLIDSLQKPTSALVFFLGVYAAIKVLPLTHSWHHGVDMLLKTAITIAFFWGLIRATHVGSLLLIESGRKKGLSVATFLPLFKQIIVVVLTGLAIIMVIGNFGFSVTSIIVTVLGVGGAALALASQSTIANFFSSVAIALDRPFKVGDVVKVRDVEGTVESMGLRCTQVRTDSHTLVSIPNSIIAADPIDNRTLTTSRRIMTNVGVTQETSEAQIQGIISDIKGLMKEMTGELAESPQLVYFDSIAESSFNIQVIAYTVRPDILEFFRIRQKFLLGIMKVVEKNGSSFAYPSRTLYMAQGKKQGAALAENL